ncbi:MAG: GNAT family N-acetyltransferase [Eubacteriales bacterium]|nr:GNAT family N-acetyltransferase [Eubacteriales bacterium]
MENSNIHLCKMTTVLAKEYFQNFTHDPDVFMDGQKFRVKFRVFVYSDSHAEQMVQRQEQLNRVYLAIMLYERPIGEIVLKKIHQPENSCTLGIHLQNDSVKNKGYGTQAERLALRYVFEELGLKTVYADALRKNTRSQHVLQKVGFQKIQEDESFVFYRYDRSDA